jgi:phage shock protein E
VINLIYAYIMKITTLTLLTLSMISLSAEKIVNPAIDYSAFQKLVNELGPTHEKNRVTEGDFIKMASEPKTIILDARSKIRYDRIHVKGAISMPFTEFTADRLAKVIPDKNTRILIYCNNNFDNEPVNLRRKFAAVSLNVPTFINLHAYGYTNVYELGPLLDVNTTKIPFVRSKGKSTE